MPGEQHRISESDVGADLRAALRGMARPVVVVTARLADQGFAMTATAVCEVSMDPPSMLLCVNRSAAIFPALQDGGEFVLNILGQAHSAVSRACGGGRQGADRFAVGDWDTLNAPWPPALRDAAVIRLRQVRHLDHGTHRIVVGDVLDVRLPTGNDPLIYFDGRYMAVIEGAA